jgi:iron complex transport system ATP-binding protein
VTRTLERFGIAHLADRPYTMISGGERQLALLARALAQEPQFVVLDEPTANLDPANAAAVGDALERLADGRTVLLIAHSPELAGRTDRVVRLEGGRVAHAADAVGAR